jgi:transposase
MMHALDPAVHGPIFETIKDLLPEPKPHPLGCHRRRVPDSACFAALLFRLVTGASWTTIEALLPWKVSDTTLRARRDEWIAAGVFDQILLQALAGYQRLIGFGLDHVSIDGSDKLAPGGGESAGHGYKLHGRLGWKWCVAVDADGIPMAFAIDAANRNDYPMMFEVLDQLADAGLVALIDTLHVDRGLNYAETPGRLAETYGITRLNAPVRNKRAQGTRPLVGIGKRRWIVEAFNSWISNYGQLRRNTDRKTIHRKAALQFAIAMFLVHRLTQKSTSPIR